MDDRERFVEIWKRHGPTDRLLPFWLTDALAAEFAAVRADEREACVEECRAIAIEYAAVRQGVADGAMACAAAIRARGDAK